jgi:hypothetical protein
VDEGYAVILKEGKTDRVEVLDSRWGIMSGEELRVDSLYYNGWARINYVKEGKELGGYVRIRRLKALDDTAQEMLTLAESRADRETLVITIGMILAAIGLVLSFLPLGKTGAMLQMLAFAALCAVEIWYLTTTGGFTIYSPSVVTWKSAIKWSLCFILFLAVQFKVWTGILKTFSNGYWIDGFYITLILSLIVFVALLATALIAPLNEVDKWFWNVYLGYLALNLIQVIKNFVKFGITRGLFYNIFLAAGLIAISLMSINMVVVAVFGILAGAFFSFMLRGYASGAFSMTTSWKQKVGGAPGELIHKSDAEMAAERRERAKEERKWGL